MTRIVVNGVAQDVPPAFAGTDQSDGELLYRRYRDARGKMRRTLLGSAAPISIYTNYTLAENFTASEYWVGGTQYTPVTALPGYSFTGSGAKGAVDASGAVQFFATGVAPINSAGYHAYGALTNVQTYSQDMGSRTLTGVTATSNTTAAPDGTTTADTITGAGTGITYVSLTPTFTAANYTTSLFVHKTAGTAPYVWLQVNDTIDNPKCVILNKSTGALTASDVGLPAAYYSVSCGSYWRVVIVVPGAAVARFVGFGPTDVSNNRSTATNGQTFVAWEGNSLLGNFPDGGPIITTTGAALGIGASVLSHTITAPTDVDQIFLAKFTPRTIAGASQDFFQLLNTTTDRILMRIEGGSLKSYVFVAGVQIAAPTAGTPVAGTEYKMVMKREAGAWRTGYLVGGTLTWFAAAVTGAFPAGMVNVQVGHDNGAGQLNGNIAETDIRLGTFTDGELQTLMVAM